MEDDKPKGRKPRVAKPKVEAPAVEKPKARKPKVAKPKVAKPRVAKPKVETPAVEKPKVAKPKVEKPKRPKAKGLADVVVQVASEEPEELATVGLDDLIAQVAIEEPDGPKPEGLDDAIAQVAGEKPMGPIIKGLDAAIAVAAEAHAEKVRILEGAPVPGARASNPLIWLAVVLLAALNAWVWLASPAWLDVPVSDPLPIELEDAGVRMEVYLQAVNVQDFLDREARLPNSLEEAGDAFTLVRYERLDADRYQLAMDGPDGEVRYQSTDPLEGFLGTAMQTIREGR